MDTNRPDAGILAIVAIVCTSIVGAVASYDLAMVVAINDAMTYMAGSEFVGRYLADHLRFASEICHIGLYALIAIIVVVRSRKSHAKSQAEAMIFFTFVYLALCLGASFWMYGSWNW